MINKSTVLDQQVNHPISAGEQHFPVFAMTSELEAKIDEVITHYPEQIRSSVLPILHLIQHQFGFISAQAITWISEKIELEPIRILEVVSFYPGFHQSAPGKFHIRVCRTLSCAMAGSGELMAELAKITGIDRSNCDSHHQPVAVSDCGTWSLEFAECLASCGTGPVCLVNDDFHEAVAPQQAQDLISKYSK